MSKLFDWSSYISHQTQDLLDCFWVAWGILEVTGEFLHDEIFVNLLEGYEKNSQIKIIKKLIEKKECTISYCINAKDVVRDKQLSKKYLSFEKYILKQLALIKSSLGINPQIIITMLDKDFIPPHIRELEELTKQQGYTSIRFYIGDIYHIKENSLHIITSYGEKTGKSTIANSSWKQSVGYASLPIEEYDDNHSLNLIAKCYNYNSQDKEQKNISHLSRYILNKDDIVLKEKGLTILKERLAYYENLYTSWYAEEEQIDEIKSLLTKIAII